MDELIDLLQAVVSSCFATGEHWLAMADPIENATLKKSVSENTYNKTSNGFKRFNIMQNNGSVENRRHSIAMNDEYDSSESNVDSNGSDGFEGLESADENKIPGELYEPEILDEKGTSKLSSTSSASTIKYVPKNLVEKHVKNSKVRYSKNGKMRSNFGDLNFMPRETILDKEIHFGAKFFGLFIALWIIVFFMGLNVLCGYQMTHGSLFKSFIFRLMLKDLWKVALTDLLMYLSMYFSVILQLLIKKNLIKWKNTGYTLQVIYEILLLSFPLYYADTMNYPWIAQIFLMLHACVMLMKVHSYAFFNGYLWEIYDEFQFSQKIIKKGYFENDDVENALKNSIEFCSSEIKAQNFPNNLGFFNFFEYSMFPVLVYQTNYPRNDHIRWDYLFKKIIGIVGIILLMITISQQRLYPIVMKCLELQQTTTFMYRVKTYPFILIETIPPFLSIYLLVFYLIWELILNAIAELSRFADREFYGYWWNSIDWNEYARDWNVPVHKFLLRHVYHSSISAFHVNKTLATFMTFFLSSLIHELAMYVIFKKVRFYLLMLQMNQLSLVQLSKTKWMKDKLILGNCIFWFGVVFGPSLMCTMYLVF